MVRLVRRSFSEVGGTSRYGLPKEKVSACLVLFLLCRDPVDENPDTHRGEILIFNMGATEGGYT